MLARIAAWLSFLACLLVFAAPGLTSAAGLPAAHAPAPALAAPGDLKLQRFQVQPDAYRAGDAVTISFRLQNDTGQDIFIGRAGLGLRGPDACAYENPWDAPSPFDPGGWSNVQVYAGGWIHMSLRVTFSQPGVYIVEPVYDAGDGRYPPFANSRPRWLEVRDGNGEFVAQNCLLSLEQSLSVEPASGRPGDEFTAAFTLHNRSGHEVMLYDLKAAGRQGINWAAPGMADFPGSDVLIAPGASYAYAERAVRPAEGTYFAEPWFSRAAFNTGDGSPLPAFIGYNNRAVYNVRPSPLPSNVIGGMVVLEEGVHLDMLTNVTVCLDGAQCTLSDSEGFYMFYGVPAGTHTITASKPGYTFLTLGPAVPPDMVYADIQGAWAWERTFSLHGRIQHRDTGAYLDGIRVCVDADHCGTTGGADHEYWIAGLPAGTHTVTPANEAYDFSPASRTMTLPLAPEMQVDFTAGPKPAPTGVVWGLVTHRDTGAWLDGIRLCAGPDHCATTGGADHWYVLDLPYGAYRITPSSDDYTFDPPYQDLVVPQADPYMTPINFTAIPRPQLSAMYGRVFEQGTGALLDGITVCAAGYGCDTTSSATDHWYGIQGLPPGVHRVTPYSACHTFDPPYRDVSVPEQGQQPVDFTAVSPVTPTPYPPTDTPTVPPPTHTPTVPPPTHTPTARPPTHTPTARPPTHTPTRLPPIDAAELAAQSEWLSVAPGAAISPWIEVRNTGNTTWTPADYGFNGKGQFAGDTGYLTRNVPPGGAYRFSWNRAAPTAPGAYDYGFVLRHGTKEFGPYFFVRVTVVGPRVSGRVTDGSGRGLAGVTISDETGRTTSTDGSGNYTLTGLSAGKHTLTPAKAALAFVPPVREVDVPPDRSGQDFATVQIADIQVNQVLGNTPYHVAGKNTSVRVLLQSGHTVPFDPPHQQVVVTRDGVPVGVLQPQWFPGRANVVDFLCNPDDCKNWQPGPYTFQATLNGAGHIESGVKFEARRPLRVLAVPIRIKDQGRVLEPNVDWGQAFEFTAQVYPVPGVDVVAYAGGVLDATDLTFGFASDDPGRKALWGRLQDLQSNNWCNLIGLPGCYDAIVGIIPAIQICRDGQDKPCLGGWTYGIPSAVVMADQNIGNTTAHEIGHMIGRSSIQAFGGGLGDEYGQAENQANLCGAFQCLINPPPKAYCGRDGASTCTSKFRCTASQAVAWEGKTGSGSRVVAATDAPYDVLKPGPLGDRLSFMGSGSEDPANYWITPAVYKYLFEHLAPGILANQAAATDERILTVSGWIGKNGATTLDPAYHSIGAAPPAATGAYRVDVLDAANRVLAGQGFDLSFVTLSNPPQDLDRAPFEVGVRFPTGARKVRLMHGTALLTESKVSSRAPTVSLSYPTGGEVWGSTGAYTIRWQASDPDRDALRYTVQYRQGSGEWSVLAADLTSPQLAVDARSLPGGNAARLRVMATDGFNTSVAESGAPFTVGGKPPEVSITSPAEGAVLPVGLAFFLQATAYDREDGRLTVSALRWRSDLDGELGSGSPLLAHLSVGRHTLTLTGKDRDGNSAAATIRLTVSKLGVYLPVLGRKVVIPLRPPSTAIPAPTATRRSPSAAPPAVTW